MEEHWENLNALTAPLLLWYDAHKRTMPWRTVVTPYRTWVSEIMLQQTRVSAVIPYFERFMSELPTVSALAGVSEERLLKLWEGLGYYSRARNLQKAATIIVSEYGGKLPETAAELKKLPGIGDYTAAAIASINYGEPAAAVDGNLLRVAARVSGCGEDIMDAKVRRRFAEKLNEAIDPERPGECNQAMMDLGATVCLPNGMPLCKKCPAQGICEAYRRGLTQVLPVRAEKKPRRAEERTVFLLLRGGRIAVRTRGEAGLLAHLTEYPNTEGNLDEAGAAIALARWGLSVRRLESVGTAKHIFTHIEWQMKGYAAEVTGECPDFRWVDRAEFDTLAIPTAFKKFTAKAKELL